MITYKDTAPSFEIFGVVTCRPAGTVFEGRLVGVDEPVVVAKLGDDPEGLARARQALALRHAAIACNHAIVQLEDGPAIVQARPPGRPLPELDDVALLNLQSSVIDLVDQVLAALEHAHALGVTHGDLSSDDLVIDGKRVRIRRFGFARPSRPPSPRYDLLALGDCLAPLIVDEELRALVASPTTDAGSLRRLLREAQARQVGSLGVTEAPGAIALSGIPQSSDAFAHTDASSAPSSSSARSSSPSSSPFSSPSSSSSSRAPRAPAPKRITPEALIGRKLGDFEVREKLAEGGLGMVFRALQPSLNRKAVIKIPFSRKGTSERLLQRFMHEAQLASRLDHPYAAHIYAFGNEPDGLMWIAMELVDGTPLDEYLRVCGPMQPARAVAFVERLAQVLHRAHELSIVHRDIKPSNVMVLQRSGRLLPKLLDFGIARDSSARSGESVPISMAKTLTPGSTTAPIGSLTLRGAVMGSPLYMAPEQWIDASQVGPAADIYSLGVLAYEVLTGRPPFHGSTLTEVEAAHASAPIPSLGVHLPRALDEVVTRALAKRSGDRYATALDFSAALDAAIGGGVQKTPLPQLDDAVRIAMLERGPAPVAEALSALESARNAHQGLAALDQLVDAAANWLGVLMLAARSRTGPPAGGDSGPARALVRELGRRTLDAGDWLALARELARPFAARPELHPLAELIAFVAAPGPLDELLAARRRHRDLAEERVRGELVESVATLGRLLSALDFVRHYRVVVVRSGRPELWAGLRRGARPAIVVRGDGVVEGEAFIVDSDGIPLLRLHPLVQVARPMPGGVDELFVVAGGGVDGGRLTTPPHGFELTSPDVLAWLRANVLIADGDEGAPSAALERPPYRGLSAFTSDDADNFVGREREREAFLNRLRVQSLLAVVGRSGSGKSSFVQAGVIPHLPAGFSSVTMRPGATPMATLQARLPAETGEPTLLVVDQFEELFTLCRDADERQRFARALVAASDAPNRRVILTLRDDFLIPAEELEALRDRLGPALVLLAAPGPEDLERIVVEPARRRGYDFDDVKLPRRMVREVVDQPGGLAMLSFAAAELWERRDRHFKKLLVRAYDAMGGVTGALVGHAEAMLAEMTAGERALVRDVFRRLVTAEGTRAVIGKKELIETLGDAGRGASAIEKLIGSRLVVASEGAAGVEQVEVAHETLLQAWPRLVEWRREDQEGARLREQLRDAARQWDQRGRPHGLLWRDDALTEYRLWRKRHGGGLSAVESAFADASVDAERRSVRRRRVGIAIGFAVMTLVSLGLWTLNRRAERATAETRQRLVDSYLAQARTKLLGGRRWEALASVVAAQKMGAGGPAVDLIRGLARDPARALERRLRANHSRTWSVDYSPDGKLLLTTGEDGASLWEVDSGKLRAQLQGHDGSVRDGAFSPDGTRIATIGFDSTVRLWDGKSGSALRVLRGHTSIVRCLAWRGDGARLATTDEVGGVRIWDPERGTSETSLSTGSRTSACGYGGDRLAVGTTLGGVFVVERGSLVKIGNNDDWTRSLRFASDGERIVTASSDKMVRVWDVPRRRLVSELRGAGDALLFANFSPDGRRVVAGSRDATARVWDAATGRLQLTLAGHRGVVWYAEFDGKGERIVTSADDGSARVWDASTGLPLALLEGHDKAVSRARFSPDGAHVASSSYDGTVAIWRTAPAHVLGDIPGWADAMCSRSGDARHGYVMSCRGGTRVWLPSAPNQLVTLPPSELSATSLTRAVTVEESRSNRARVWTLPSGALEREIDMPSPITAVAIDDTRLAIAADSGAVHVFARDGHERYATTGGARRITLVDDERWLLFADDGAVSVLTGGHLDATLQAPRPTASSAEQTEVSPGGDLVAIGRNSDIILVRLRGAPQLARLTGHQAPLLMARFDSDGRRLVTTSEDGTGIVWDVASGRLLQRLTPKSQYLADAIFDASGQMIVATDGQGGLEFFGADTAQLLGTVDGSGQPGLFLGRLDDGTMAALSASGGLTRWRVEPDRDPIAAVERDLACKAPPGIEAGRCTP